MATALPWLKMRVAKAEPGRSRIVPVAEIEAMQKEMAALRAYIAELEAALTKATRKTTKAS